MKGFFTQCYVVLTKGPIDLEEIRTVLDSKYKVIKKNVASENWEISGESLHVEFDRENNGAVAIDFVDHRWPDSMGSKEEPILFGAWSTGHFGPFTYPNGLKRSLEQAWRLSKEERLAFDHTGFIRIKLSYVFGLADDAKILPKSYDPIKELDFLNSLVQAILQSINEPMYFNPNGEILLTLDAFSASLETSKSNDLPAFDLISNVRLYNIDEQFSLMDSVGNLQIDLPDMEVVVPRAQSDLGTVDVFIRNATYYLQQNGEVIRHGDTMEGPGGINWRGFHFESGLCDPPRRTIRWFPTNIDRFPTSILPQEDRKPEKKWWKFGR